MPRKWLELAFGLWPCPPGHPEGTEGSLEQDWRSLALQRETFKQAGV